MNTRLIFTVFFITLFSFSFGAFADNPPATNIEEEVATAIRSGNAAALARNFNNTVDLVVPGQEISCSKTQAEQIVKDFFQKNPPKSFKINHQGASKDGSQFSIGTYVSTGNKSFRTYFLLKKSGPGLLIHQLQFEAE
jgi:hypothetical protein